MAAAAQAELIDFCAARIPRHKRPRLVRFVERLPRTPAGKIRKAALRDPYWRGRERKIRIGPEQVLDSERIPDSESAPVCIGPDRALDSECAPV